MRVTSDKRSAEFNDDEGIRSRLVAAPGHQESIVSAPSVALPQTIIRPARGWRVINWRELLQYRDTLWFLVLRDIKVLYKQTVLGFGWAILRPVLGMLIFSVVFGGLADVPSDGVPYPIFSYAALLPWTYFSTTMTQSIQSLVGNAPMFTKIYFPRMIIPLTPVIAGLVDFAIAAVVLAVMMVWYGLYPGIEILYLPLLLLQMVLTAVGVSMWLSAMAIQYRDLKHASTFLVQFMMYAAPVVWPTSLINDRFPEHATAIRMVYGLYPMAGVIEGFRATLLGTTPMPWDIIGSGVVGTIVIFITGSLYFNQKERIFSDVA